MKQSIHKQIKTISLFIIALLLSACILACLVSCNDDATPGTNDTDAPPIDDDTHGGENTSGDASNTDYNIAYVWNKIIGFVLSNESSIGSFGFYDSSYDETRTTLGEENLGYVFFSNDIYSVYIAFYDSYETAEKNIEFVESAWDSDEGMSFTVKQDKNALIIDGNDCSYDALMQSNMPVASISEHAFDFIINHSSLTLPENANVVIGLLSKGLNSNKDGVEFRSCTLNGGSSTEYGYFSKKEDFLSNSENSITDIINKFGTSYTNDSYIAVKGEELYSCLIDNPGYVD